MTCGGGGSDLPWGVSDLPGVPHRMKEEHGSAFQVALRFLSPRGLAQGASLPDPGCVCFWTAR